MQGDQERKEYRKQWMAKNLNKYREYQRRYMSNYRKGKKNLSIYLDPKCSLMFSVLKENLRRANPGVRVTDSWSIEFMLSNSSMVVANAEGSK